jgi:hypothetical protein
MPENIFNPETLKAPLGKLPVWAWGLIGGTAVLGAYYLTKARSNARQVNAGVNGTGNDTLNSANTGMATPDLTSNAVLPVAGYNGETISNGDNALGNSSLETNVTWLNRGIKVASNNGNSALVSATALQKYLQGKPVTAAEQSVVSDVLNALGYPPEGSPLLVKAIQDSKPTPAKPIQKPATATNTTDKPKLSLFSKTPKPEVAATKTGANGYPLDNNGKEIIQYSGQYPLEILNGKFQGKQVNLNYQPDKFTYVKVDNTIPGSYTR